jgi:hypothetical protein
MAIETLSYTIKGKGWNTFHSFIPDMMVGMNSNLYSFKDGNLYLHNDNETRNNYYGVNYPSKITSIINNAPSETKIFDTIALEGNEAWTCDIVTDLNTGFITDTFFEEKEGEFYANIRRTSGTVDTKSLAVQGVGEVLSYTAGVITMTTTVGSNVCQGDKVYKDVAGVNTEIGTVTSISGSVINISPVVLAPNPTDFLYVAKDSVAESYGLRGYHMTVEMTNNSTSRVELFSVASETIKSYP